MRYFVLASALEGRHIELTLKLTLCPVQPPTPAGRIYLGLYQRNQLREHFPSTDFRIETEYDIGDEVCRYELGDWNGATPRDRYRVGVVRAITAREGYDTIYSVIPRLPDEPRRWWWRLVFHTGRHPRDWPGDAVLLTSHVKGSALFSEDYTVYP